MRTLKSNVSALMFFKALFDDDITLKQPIALRIISNQVETKAINVYDD
jgi:hypothetical protein